MDANRLITEVHKRPALWNQRHLSYHNRDVTNRIWMEIAALFKLPKQVLKTKWKGLRDTFRAEIKKEQVYRKSKYTSNRPAWIHFETLQFLKEQMLPRPPIWERTDNSRENEDTCSGIYMPPPPEAASNLGITLVDGKNHHRREDPIDIITTKHDNRPTGRKISSHFQENLETLEDSRAADSRENVPSAKSPDNHLLPTVFDSPSPHRSDTLGRNNSNSSCNNNNQVEETSAVIKLEPADHYENNVRELGNVAAEETNNLDENNGPMFKKITTEEVMMAESCGDNYRVIGSQSAVDPLEVNRFDDNYYFLMSLLPHIRTLPAERRMLLRMQMQQLVYQEVYDKNRSSLSTFLSSPLHEQRP